jgi:two-component system OmpR family sensor kinase
VRFHGRGYFRGQLHQRIFFWFGASILLTGVMVISVMQLLGEGGFWRRELQHGAAFLEEQFARYWDSPSDRDALAQGIASNFETAVIVLNSRGEVLGVYGGACNRVEFSLRIFKNSEPRGEVKICRHRHLTWGLWRVLLPLLLSGAMLWAASGRIARRLARPLWELSRVAQDIGSGHLSSRMHLRPHGPGEVREIRVLSYSINDMAARIERQLADQRELLAAVSHELRTPLSRIRLLVELIRVNGADPKALDDLDREVVEIDSLVGELLASSRLDFAALTPHSLDAVEVAKRALDRAGLSTSLLSAEGTPRPFEADAGLIARALANLIENAKVHGGGLTGLRVRFGSKAVAFEAEDSGPGFSSGEAGRVFSPLHRQPGKTRDAGSLGLGLALVRRIAEAHGGKAYASNRPQGGAIVGFEVAGAPQAS